jgi:uncharacterized protein
MDFTKVLIVFHGGEPLLQPIAQFEDMCSIFQKELSEIINIEYKFQTNATLITNRWINIFSKYNISVGVSLDGPREYNDIDRVDHQNKGSYDLVRAGIEMLQKAVLDGKISAITSYCVINPTRDPVIIYRHLVDELKIKYMDYLLPDITHDDPFSIDPVQYGYFLCKLFEEWVKDKNPNVKIRFFLSLMNVLTGKNSLITSMGPGLDNIFILTVSSNGQLSPDDILRKAGCGKVMDLAHVNQTSAKNFFEMPILQSIRSCKQTLPKDCTDCCWQKICGGGSYIHRYSEKNNFDNSSVMCEALKMIFSKTSAFLLQSGLPASKLQEVLM